MSPKKRAAVDGVVLIAPDGVGAYGCAHGSFEVVDGTITVPRDAVPDAIASGFLVHPDSGAPESESEAEEPV